MGLAVKLRPTLSCKHWPSPRVTKVKASSCSLQLLQEETSGPDHSGTGLYTKHSRTQSTVQTIWRAWVCP